MRTYKDYIITSLHNIIDYNWKDELRKFQENFQIEIQYPINIKNIIKLCDNEMKNNIFYKLMILKNSLEEDLTDEEINDSTIFNSIERIVNYNFEKERKDFEEAYNVNINLDGKIDLFVWKRICEKEGWIHHIFYDILVVYSWWEVEYMTDGFY